MILLTAAFTKMNLVLSGHTQRADMANRTDINENSRGETTPSHIFKLAWMWQCGSTYGAKKDPAHINGAPGAKCGLDALKHGEV